MRKIALVLVVVALAGVGGFFGLRAYAGKEAEKQVDALFAELQAGGIKASRQAVGFDVVSRTLDLTGLDFASSAGTTRIDHFQASGFEQPSPERVKAARIEITGLTVESTLGLAPGSSASYRLPKVVVENYEGPAVIEAGGGDVGIVLRDFLTAFSAATITAPEATIVTRAGTDASTTTTEIRYGASTATGLRNGVVSAFTSAPAQFTIKGPADQAAASGSGEVGKVSAETVDLVATLLPFTPPANPADTTFRTVYGRLNVDGVKVKTDNGMSIESGTIALSDAAARPSAALIAEIAAVSAIIEEDQKEDRTPEPEVMRRMFAALAQIADALRVGAFSVADIRMSMPGEGSTRIAALRMGPMADGRVGTLALEGLEGATGADGDKPAKPFKLARFAINGFDFARLMQLAEKVAPDLGSADSLQNRLAALRILEGVEITGLVAPAVDAAEGDIKLDTFQLSWGNFIGALPTKFAGTLRIDAPLATFGGEEWAGMLAASGAKRASVAMDIGGAWNEANGTVTLSPLFAEVSQAFSASAKLSVTGLGRDAFNDDAGQALAAAMQAKLGSVSLNLADLGIYELKIAEVAKEQDATPEAVRELFTGIAEMIIAQVTTERPDLEPAGKAVLDFLSAPKGKLAVTITPKEPMPIVSAMIASQVDPMSLVDAVNIEATSSR